MLIFILIHLLSRILSSTSFMCILLTDIWKYVVALWWGLLCAATSVVKRERDISDLVCVLTFQKRLNQNTAINKYAKPIKHSH